MTVVLKPIIANQPIEPNFIGDCQQFLCIATFSGVYKTGGDETVKPLLEQQLKQLGVGIIEWVNISGIIGFNFVFNYVTGKLQVVDSAAAGVEFKELTEAEYPATIREGQARLNLMGT